MSQHRAFLLASVDFLKLQYLIDVEDLSVCHYFQLILWPGYNTLFHLLDKPRIQNKGMKKGHLKKIHIPTYLFSSKGVVTRSAFKNEFS